ncbi:MAG: FtsX-like permease family protein [Paracoccaceae bacterium]
MTAAIAQALAGHWRRNPLQLFTLVAGLALATALWSGVQAVNAEARASYDAAASVVGEGSFAQIASPSGAIEIDTYVALRRAGWLVSPLVEGRVDGLRLLGIDPLTAPQGIGGGTLTPADLPDAVGDAGVAFGDPASLSRLSQAFGDAAPSGTEAEVAPNTVVTDISTALRLLDRTAPGTPAFDRLIVAPVQPLSRPPLQDVAPGLTLRAPQAGSDVGRLTDSFHLNLTAFGFLAFAVGIFIVHGAIGLAFEQRRATFRTLRSLGVPLRALLGALAAELLILALLAGALGVALGYVIAALLLPDVAATLGGLYGASVSGTLALRPEWWAAGLGIAVAGAALAGAGAAIRLARMPILAAGRPRAWAMAAGRGRLLQLGTGAALLLAAAALAAFGSGLVAGFALLGALLTGAALLLPTLLDLALRAAARTARGAPLAEWFWADTRQQLPGLSLALMALLLAMAANIGVSTMVGSFRTTFVGFLDQRLASELYVYAEDDAQAARLLTLVEGRVDAVLPVISVRRDIAGAPAELFGARPHPTYSDNWAFLDAAPDAWGRVFDGTAVVVNEQMARRQGVALGDALTVAPGTTLPVAGIYGDYGNPIGQAVIGLPLFEALFPSVRAQRFGLRLPPGDVDALQSELIAAGVPEGNVIDQQAIKRLSLDIFERTFTVTGALNVLTLSVAGFAILTSLLTLAGMRLPQLAPVWALGVTRRRLGLLELGRAVAMAALVALLALPLGLLLAWVLLAVVNVEAFGWRLPMRAFPADYAALGAWALLAAALAAAWPAWRLSRTAPARLLGVFANDR